MFKNKEYVLAIYREKSFTKAAEALFVSQPSLSASVKRIEQKISEPIFDRSSNPLKLTEVGEEYVRCAIEIEEMEKNFERYVSDHTKLLKGTIRIGGSSFFSSLILPKLIRDFNENYPQIKFEIYEDNTKNLMNKLSNGELDIVVDNTINEDENILASVFLPERILLAVPKSFKVNDGLEKYKMEGDDVKLNKHLSDIPSVDLSVFKDQPFVLLNPENDTGKRALKLFKKCGVLPNVLFKLDQQVTAFNVACAGMAISFVSDTLVKGLNSEREVYYYSISDKQAERNIYLYQKKNHYLSLASRYFIERNTLKQ
ncbi:MAG: LysR family transcriptional regulator [Clostridia bacterium]|nr:LysR family transcriptional regulator [Clostridia bacterium]